MTDSERLIEAAMAVREARAAIRRLLLDAEAPSAMRALFDVGETLLDALASLPPEAQERASGGPIRDSKQRGMPWA